MKYVCKVEGRKVYFSPLEGPATLYSTSGAFVSFSGLGWHCLWQRKQAQGQYDQDIEAWHASTDIQR